MERAWSFLQSAQNRRFWIGLASSFPPLSAPGACAWIRDGTQHHPSGADLCVPVSTAGTQHPKSRPIQCFWCLIYELDKVAEPPWTAATGGDAARQRTQPHGSGRLASLPPGGPILCRGASPAAGAATSPGPTIPGSARPPGTRRGARGQAASRARPSARAHWAMRSRASDARVGMASRITSRPACLLRRWSAFVPMGNGGGPSRWRSNGG